MNESHEFNRNPNDQEQRGSSSREVSRSPSRNPRDYERPALENHEPRNPGDRAVSRPRSSSGALDIVRDGSRSGRQPHIEHDSEEFASHKGKNTGMLPPSLYAGTWNWPSSLNAKLTQNETLSPTSDTEMERMQQSGFKDQKGKGKQIDEKKHFDGVAQNLTKRFMEQMEAKEKGLLTSGREQQITGMSVEELAQGLGKAYTEAWLKKLAKDGRGVKTIKIAYEEKAQTMVDKWQTENLPYADQVNAQMVWKNFPQISLATQLEKEYDRLVMEDSILILRIPGNVRASMNHEWNDRILKLDKEYTTLEKTFPKNPSEVLARKDDIDRKAQEKVQTMVDKWRTENPQLPPEVNTPRILHCFTSIREATALEMVKTDAISVKQSLQEAEEKFPKNALDAWITILNTTVFARNVRS